MIIKLHKTYNADFTYKISPYKRYYENKGQIVFRVEPRISTAKLTNYENVYYYLFWDVPVYYRR